MTATVQRGYNQRAAVPVRAVREQHGISLRQLQEATGINRAVWSQIERGRLLPEPRHIAALSHALGVPYEQWRIRFQLERPIVAEIWPEFRRRWEASERMQARLAAAASSFPAEAVREIARLLSEEVGYLGEHMPEERRSIAPFACSGQTYHCSTCERVDNLLGLLAAHEETRA